MNAGEALRSITGFSTARIIEPLSDGPSNSSYRVRRGGEDFVLRLDKPATTELGLDRATEKQVCDTVAAAGLAPAPVWFDLERGLYLRHFQSGATWSVDQMHDKANLERLAGVFRQVHRLPAPAKQFEPAAAASRYARQLGGAEAQRLSQHAGQLWQELQGTRQPDCLSHNDPVHSNILESSRLMLIDWEYAAAGDAWFDLAVVVQHHDLQQPLRDHFLQCYLQRGLRAEDRQRLRLMADFYQLLLQLWKLRVR